MEENEKNYIQGRVTPNVSYPNKEYFEEISDSIVLEDPKSYGRWGRAVITDESLLNEISGYLTLRMHIAQGTVGRDDAYGKTMTDTFKISPGLKNYLKSLNLWNKVDSIQGMTGSVWDVYSIDYRHNTIRAMGIG